MMINIKLGDKQDLAWAKETVVEHHYLHAWPNQRSRPTPYIITYGDLRLGLVVVSLPHAVQCGGWWGYEGLPTKWQVLDLCRIWLDPRLQKGGDLCKPDIVPGFVGWRGRWWPRAAGWAIEEVLNRVQFDWISLWPPVYPQEPYHVLLAISYHDPSYHHGNLYRKTGAVPMYTDEAGNPRPSKGGKFGWCWRLPEPAWTWRDITIRRPRTMRLPMEV